MLAYPRSRSLTLGPLLLVACIGCARGDAGMRTAELPWGIGGGNNAPRTACRAVLAPAQLSAMDTAPQPRLPLPLPPLPERLDGREASQQLDAAFGRLDQASRQMPVVWRATPSQCMLRPTRLPQTTASAANQPPAISPWMR